MVLGFDFSNRPAPIGLSKFDVVASIGLPAVAFGCRVGLSAALVRSLFHVVRQSPVRPGFLRTTAQASAISAGTMVVKPLYDHITGTRDVYDGFFLSHPEFRPRAQENEPTREERKWMAWSMITTACHMGGMGSGAIYVAELSGGVRGQWFRMLGGACVGNVMTTCLLALAARVFTNVHWDDL
ncbi:hypothetical protein CKM354_000641100 [Cercospora kikuchii]|uniref:Uncharacterized protein n=1 Tax=Cercospora kikuchii TaxID=84275 RepID=A0A9P3FDD6_9PEZI|nr:uncharacterized protein CKM354_000641100 [Cercospora kikuchii]GIZ43173.1 hypothetical protein CKM354_000641100 [Cercospora kikuchii]